MKEEVRRLEDNEFIREAIDPKWVSNLVLFKKHSRKWKACIGFSNLNQAYPKDSFPLPIIDQLMDATAGHELLNFMDAYLRYNQIPMNQSDEEHISFITDMGSTVIGSGLSDYRMLGRAIRDWLTECSLIFFAKQWKYMWMICL